MKEQLAKIEREALETITKAADPAALDELRVKYLGKKGELTAVLKQMGKLSAEERPVIGQLANDVREKLTAEIEAQKKKLEEDQKDLEKFRDYVKTDEYAEEVAREKFGLVYKDEIIFEPEKK